VQEAIARAIAGALRVRLAEGIPLTAPQRTTDAQTYDLYLRGRYLWWNATSEPGVRESMRESMREFRRALARDTAFAPAWVGLADAHFGLTAYYDVAPGAIVAPARAALRRALALDTTSADVHAGLGYLHTFHDLDWPAAESHFRRALALDPRNGRAHLYYAWMLAVRGRHAEALGEIRRARSLDPLDPRIAVRVGTIRYLAGDLAGAVEECRRVAGQNPGFALAHRQLGEALVQQPGQAPAGVAALRQAAALWPTTETRARLAYGLARAGAVADARRLLAELERGAAQAYVSPYERARVHVGLGEPDRALELLERAYDVGTSALVLAAADPAFAPLRGAAVPRPTQTPRPRVVAARRAGSARRGARPGRWWPSRGRAQPTSRSDPAQRSTCRPGNPTKQPRGNESDASDDQGRAGRRQGGDHPGRGSSGRRAASSTGISSPAQRPRAGRGPPGAPRDRSVSRSRPLSRLTRCRIPHPASRIPPPGPARRFRAAGRRHRPRNFPWPQRRSSPSRCSPTSS
jgi:Tfp pilus assembly protein PilF